MKKMLAVILIVLFGSVGLAYGQSATDAETQTQTIRYCNKIDELHSRMKREFDIIAQSGVQNAVAVWAERIPNIKKLMTERDNLKLEALTYYHGKLPPDLATKFEKSERITDQTKKIIQDADRDAEAARKMAQAQPAPRSQPQPDPRLQSPLTRSSGSEPVYRVDKLTEYELELVHNLLIEKGYKGLTPTQGTHKWSMDKKQPEHFTVVCGKANGGIVRVEVKMTKYPLEETFIKILK